ncbi:hypothetical protein BDQ17DRAFT_1372409 [Cyathus striatus]|nr:hypothetical protein BDQ17DRAFT_1372409 [Cyathus striatus]
MRYVRFLPLPFLLASPFSWITITFDFPLASSRFNVNIQTTPPNVPTRNPTSRLFHLRFFLGRGFRVGRYKRRSSFPYNNNTRTPTRTPTTTHIPPPIPPSNAPTRPRAIRRIGGNIRFA